MLQYEPFLQRMNRNGFVLNGETREFGYPIYKFSKAFDQTKEQLKLVILKYADIINRPFAAEMSLLHQDCQASCHPTATLKIK